MTSTSNLGGIAAMLAATAFYVIGDSMMKLATEDLPAFEVLAIRGVAASVACFALIALRGETRAIPSALDATTFLRAVAETLCTLSYLFALSRLPIADVVAIMQTAPLLVILGAAIFLRERVGALRIALVLAGFGGALMVARPGAQGIGSAAAVAFASATMLAGRELLSRRVPSRIPVSVVTLVTTLMVLAAAAAISFVGETWTPPTGRHLAFLGAAGVLVTLGNAGVMLAYRIGRASAVAPFFYSFALWGVVAGFVVWGAWPAALSLAGVAVIVGSGIALVAIDQRRRPRAFVAEPT